MSDRPRSAPAGRRARDHVENPIWQRMIDHGQVPQRRRDPTTIWEKRLPDKRHLRRLSSSNIGLSGSSPTYVHIRGASPTREQKCRDRIRMTLEMGNIEQLWEIYIESSALHPDDHKDWPLPNSEFVKVRKAIERGLRRKIKAALEADRLEDLEAAAQVASNKVQILAFQGNAKFPELDQVYRRINQLQSELVGMTRKSAVPDGQRLRAQEALDAALEAQDRGALGEAIFKAIEAGVDVTEALPHVKVTSSYFSKDKVDGLFDKGCFQGQKRMVHILNLGPEMDLNLLQRLLQVRGVGMKYYSQTKALFKCPQDRESRKGMSIAAALAGKQFGGVPLIMQEPKRHTVWIISGPEPGKLVGDMASVGKLIEFNRQGGGLAIVGSGNRGGHFSPLIVDANVLLAALSLERMWGHSDGKKQLGPQPSAGKPGISKDHPVLTGVPKLDEGFSVTALAESVLRQGYVELQRGSSGKLLTAIREPSRAFSGGHGPIVLHASPVQLLGSKEGVGQEQWICNLVLYSCLRAEDMTESFKFGDGPDEGDPGLGELVEDEDEDVDVIGDEESDESGEF